MTEIKYKLVNGEPVCSAEDCPMQTTTKKIPEDCHLCNRDTPCIPGLRQQRDDARAVIETMADEIAAARCAVGVDECYSQTRHGVIEEFRTLLPAPATEKDGE